MDAERRRQLEERRKFAQARWNAKQWREGLQPALAALEAAGEPFRVYGLGEEPSWNPRWIPAGYSYIPWQDLDGVHVHKPINERDEMADVLRALLAERLGADDEVLFVGEGKGWSFAMPRRVFDVHAEALLDTAWDSAFLAHPPEQWLIYAHWNEVLWKDD